MDEQVSTDVGLNDLAARQHGVVARSQLGFGRGAVAHRIESGRLISIHRGVYAVGHVQRSRHSMWMAAVLACGEGAVLSHLSAAMLLGLRKSAPLRAEVTARWDRRHAGVLVHRARLHEPDRTVRDGIPVTSDARTLADLGHVLDADEFEFVVREAQYQRRFRVGDLEDALTRRPCAPLRRLLDDIAPLRVKMELRFLRLCARHGIPRPRTQQKIGGHHVDFLWPEQRLVVETDGWQAHGTRRAFQFDRSSTNALQLAGHTVLRFTDHDLRRRQAKVAQQVLAGLGYSAGNRSSTHSTPNGSRRYGRPPTST